METDAAFTLVLCALVLQAGQAGPWVLAAGLMRYAFVAAARGLALAGGAAAAEPAPPDGVRGADHHADRLPGPDRAAAAGRRRWPPSAWPCCGLSFAIDVRTLARARRTNLET